MDNESKVLITTLDTSPAVSSLVDDIRNDVDLDGTDNWGDEPTSQEPDYASLDLTYEELADIVTLLRPKQ